jgi:sulfate adenylyltransferase subunit 2
MLIPADDSVHLKDGEVPEKMWVRFRTLGCMPCTGAVASEAKTLEEIAAEMVSAKISERSTRIIDHGANTMEDKKREGYF